MGQVRGMWGWIMGLDNVKAIGDLDKSSLSRVWGWIMGLDNVKAIGDLDKSSLSRVVRARTFCKFQQEQ